MNPTPIVQQRCSTGTPSVPFLRRKLGLSIWRHCETQSAASRSIARAPAQQLILLRCTNINPIGPQGLRWHDRMFSIRWQRPRRPWLRSARPCRTRRRPYSRQPGTRRHWRRGRPIDATFSDNVLSVIEKVLSVIKNAGPGMMKSST